MDDGAKLYTLVNNKINSLRKKGFKEKDLKNYIKIRNECKESWNKYIKNLRKNN